MNINEKGEYMKKFILSILLLGFGFAIVAGVSMVEASPQFQVEPFPTPTPGENGVIIYTVQPGDTLYLIASVANISLDELRALNNLSETDIIHPSDLLVLGIGGPSEDSTPDVALTPFDSAPPTATPLGIQNTGIVCVLLYGDINGDTIRQDTEFSLEDGEVSIVERTGLFSATRNTTEDSTLDNPVCFESDENGIPPGEYNITVAIPDGYNPTTILSQTLQLNAGDTAILNFGAQESALSQTVELLPEGGNRSPVLGLIGGGFVFAGIILAYLSTKVDKGGFGKNLSLKPNLISRVNIEGNTKKKKPEKKTSNQKPAEKSEPPKRKRNKPKDEDAQK
jgi:hypothetical protein